MVYMGRGRGRGGSQFTSKSGGGISATTRKEKRPLESHERHDRDRSRSPMSKRPVLERLGPQREELSPSHETLRITVGNDIYKEQRARSPLSDRLGPPVKKPESFDDMKYHSDERYDQLYGGASDDDRNSRHSHQRSDRYDNRHSPNRSSHDHGRKSESYDRGKRSDSYDRGRSDSYDRGRRSDSYDRGGKSDSFDRRRRSDSYDREWKSKPHDRYRDRRSTSRDRDRRSYDHGRHGSVDLYSDKDKRDYSSRENRDHFDDRGHSGSRDRDIPRREEFQSDIHQQNESMNRYRIPEVQPAHSYPGLYASPNPNAVPMSSHIPEGAPKPLKSILKKSVPEPAYPGNNTTLTPQPRDIVTPDKPDPYGGTPRPIGHNKKPQKSFSGLPGMSSYMDIDDEERFLYGDDNEEKKKEFYDKNKRKSSEYTSYTNEERPLPTGPSSGMYPPDDRYQQQKQYPPYSDQNPPRRDTESDLLRIFTSQRGQTNPTASAPYSSQQQQPTTPTDKKAKYDPTIENILKSIGFDFEMSKRMQEKANPTIPKPKEEVQYGIDQASSFLGGELSEDIKKEIFPLKSRKESMVDVLLREAKMTSSPAEKAKPQRQDSYPIDRRDSIPKRDRSYERDSYHDDKRDIPKSIPSHSTPVPSAQPVSPSYTVPPTSYAPPVSYPTSTIPTTYDVTSTASSSYPPASTYPVSGFSSYVPPPAPYAGPPPYGMPPPGHPSMWGPPPGHPAYGTRFASPAPYSGPPPGYPPTYPPYAPPPSSQAYDTSPVSKTTIDTSKTKDTVAKSKPHSNLKTVELSKKLDNIPPRKTETKTVTVVKKVIKKGDTKVKAKGNVVSSTTTSSNRTVLPPKAKPPVKQTPEKKTAPKDMKEKLVITKVILTSKEKEKLVKEKEQNLQRLKILEQELSSLRKQQNELMRKRRRQKDGHKDPILMQNSILQDEITKQISKLRQEADEKAKVLSEASIEDSVGSVTPKRSRESSSSRQSPMVSESPAKKPRTESRLGNRSRSPNRKPSEKPKEKPKTDQLRKNDDRHSRERQKSLDRQSTSSKKSVQGSKEKSSINEKLKLPAVPTPLDKDNYKPIKPVKKVRYEFFDPGNHWCRTCNVVCSSLTSLLQHLHGKKHQALVNKYDRPWMPDELKSGSKTETPTQTKEELKVEVTPIKGQEFFMATKGYYCTLCKEHTGDDLSAEHHVKTEGHYLKYQEYLKEHPFYEQRLNLDKAAGMSLMNDEEKKQTPAKKEDKKPQPVKTEEKPKEKDPAEEARKLEQKKKMQAIWDKHIKSKQQEKNAKNKKEQNKDDKDIGKIQINILNKTGIKQQQASSAQKKNPILPPWNPVSQGQKVPQAKVEVTRKPSVDNQEPASLDDFITVGENRKIPVVSEADKKTLVTADSLIEKVARKKEEQEKKKTDDEKKSEEIKDSEKVDEKKVSTEVNTKPVDEKEKKDLEMLAINPDESIPIAEIKLPPPPSQNLSLPSENKDIKMATSTSDEMYTLYFSDDKQVIISTDETPTIETKPDDLVEIDAEANVTLLSDDETEVKQPSGFHEVEKEPVPMEIAKDSDMVVISLDSQSEESSEADISNNQPEVKTEGNDGNINTTGDEMDKFYSEIEKIETEIEKAKAEKEDISIEKAGENEDNQIGEDENKSNEMDTNAIDNLEINMKNSGEILVAENEVGLDTTDIKPDSTNKDIDSQIDENNETSQSQSDINNQIISSTAEEATSKIEVIPVKPSPFKTRKKTNKSFLKNVTAVEIVDDINEGNPIEVIGTPKDKSQTKNTIEVVHTRRSSTRIQQSQSQNTSPTSLRTRELSNLHDVINVDETEEDKKSPSKPKKAAKSPKKRITRKSSTGSKAKSKAQTKYVPKKHPQVDIVSISDDEDKYENVDSASDFSADEQELENISSSSEKFGTDIDEHLENVSSGSEIEDINDKEVELENISSDEMEGNIMTVDEVGEVDEFADFDFDDEANVLDQVGDSDEEMDATITKSQNQGIEKMELETISDSEDDFKKDKGLEAISDSELDFKKDIEEKTDLTEKEAYALKITNEEITLDKPSESNVEKEKDVQNETLTDETEEMSVDNKNEDIGNVEKTAASTDISLENIADVSICNKDNIDTDLANKKSIEISKNQTPSEEITATEVFDTVAGNGTSVETEIIKETQITIEIETNTKSAETSNLDTQAMVENVTKESDNLVQEMHVQDGNEENLKPFMEAEIDQSNSVETIDEKDLTVEKTAQINIDSATDNSKSDVSSFEDSSQPEEGTPTKPTSRGRRRGKGRGRGGTRQTPRRGRSSRKQTEMIEDDEVKENSKDEQVVSAVRNKVDASSEEKTDILEIESLNKSPITGIEAVCEEQQTTQTSDEIPAGSVELENNMEVKELCEAAPVDSTENKSETIEITSVTENQEQSVENSNLSKNKNVENPNMSDNTSNMEIDESVEIETIDITKEVFESKERESVEIETVDITKEVFESKESDNATSPTLEHETTNNITQTSSETEAQSQINDISVTQVSIEENSSQNVEDVSMDVSENLSNDDDILPLEMDDIVNSSAEITVENKEALVSSEIVEPISQTEEITTEQNENANANISNIESKKDEVISISDEEEPKCNVNESQSEKTVCVELNKDSLETFDLNVKPEMSISIDPYFESNKFSNVSNFYDLDINQLPLFQDDNASNSDNASSTSEIKIDVVLEAIDSLSRVDASPSSRFNIETKKMESEIELKDINESEVVTEEQKETTQNIIVETEDLKEKTSEDKEIKKVEQVVVALEDEEEKSQDNEDETTMSSAVNTDEDKIENPDFKDIDFDDGASDVSGISMDMGSDFEVLDECESD